MSILILVKFPEYAEHAFGFQLDVQFIQFNKLFKFFELFQLVIEFVEQLLIIEQFSITWYSVGERLAIVKQLAFQQPRRQLSLSLQRF